MAHRLFIVARGDDHLYEDLRQQFVANPEVEVLVDRRYAERRRGDRRGQGSIGGRVVSAGAVPGLPVLIVELAPTPVP